MIFVGQVVGVLRDLQPPPPKVVCAACYLDMTVRVTSTANPDAGCSLPCLTLRI